MTTWNLEDERALLASACTGSFRAFAKYAIGIPAHPRGTWWTDSVHGKLCDWLQALAEDWWKMRELPPEEQERFYLLIDAHRGSGKTMLVTTAFTMWLHLRDPDLASVIDSFQQTFSIEIASLIRLHYEGGDQHALFPWLFGIWENKDDWTKERFTHAARRSHRREASITCSSVETGICGKHPDHHVLDDPITKEKLREQGNWIGIAKKHVSSIHPALLNNSLVVFVATPYTDDDVITTAMRQDGVREVHGVPLPSEYRSFVRDDGRWHLYHLPARDREGAVTLPRAWPPAELDRWERKDPADFAAQAMLRPGAGETVPLSFEQIEECIVNDHDIPRALPVTIHLDTAFKDGKRINSGDESVIEVWGHHLGTGDVYFLEAYGSNKWRIEDFTDKFVSLVQKHRRKSRVLAITDEKIIGGKHGLWRPHLESCCRNAGFHLPRFIEVSRQGTRKIARITEAAGYWVDGHVKLRRGAPGLSKLMWQMARIGVSDHDDYADAGADVFHPEVYRIYSAVRSQDTPQPRRPFDDYLKTGRLTPASARDIYDHHHRPRETAPREPVGWEDGH